jgi:ketosteroid isomerase-like protein
VRAPVIVIGCIAFAGCVPWHRSPDIVPGRSPSRDSLLSIDLHRADTLAARGWSALDAAFLAEDIVYLRAGAPPVYGRTAVAAMVESNPRLPTTSTWQPIAAGLSQDRLSGYTYGIAVYPREEAGSPAISRYIAFWTRGRGGPWRLLAYAEVGPGSPMVTVAAAATVPPSMVGGAEAQRATMAIAASDSDFADDAALGGVGAAFANAAANDAVIFGGPEIVFGPSAIRDMLDEQRGTSLSWHPVYARAAETGDLGFSVGESVATSRGQSGAAVQRFGKYLTIWRKEPNGDWKFVVDGGNARPSPVGH